MAVLRLQPWRELLTQSVSIAARTGQDSYGKPTYSTGTAYAARVVGKRRLVVNTAGQEVASDWTVYLYGDPAVTPQDKVTLSTADVGSTAALAINPPVLAVGRYPDEIGMLYTALYLAWMLAAVLPLGV